LAKAIKFLDPENKGYPIHVSFDIDGCDPSLAPGTGTKGKGVNRIYIKIIKKKIITKSKYLSTKRGIIIFNFNLKIKDYLELLNQFLLENIFFFYIYFLFYFSSNRDWIIEKLCTS
jgi:hypothetical protein